MPCGSFAAAYTRRDPRATSSGVTGIARARSRFAGGFGASQATRTPRRSPSKASTGNLVLPLHSGLSDNLDLRRDQRRRRRGATDRLTSPCSRTVAATTTGLPQRLDRQRRRPEGRTGRRRSFNLIDNDALPRRRLQTGRAYGVPLRDRHRRAMTLSQQHLLPACAVMDMLLRRTGAWWTPAAGALRERHPRRLGLRALRRYSTAVTLLHPGTTRRQPRADRDTCFGWRVRNNYLPAAHGSQRARCWNSTAVTPAASRRPGDHSC